MIDQASHAALPAAVQLLGNLVKFRLRGSDTGNAYSLVEVVSAPGAGTPLHVQADDDETFVVLEGEYEFAHAGRTVAGKPGTVLFIRRGEPHAFRNTGTVPARMLLINSPGGFHEKFFLEAGDPAAEDAELLPPGVPDMPRLMAASARYGIAYIK